VGFPLNQKLLGKNLAFIIKLIGDRRPGGDVELKHFFTGQTFEIHDQGPKRVAVSGDENAVATENPWLDGCVIIGKDAVCRVLKAFATRRRRVIGSAPDVDLLFAPFLPGVILVEACQVSIVTLIERLIADDLEIGLTQFLQDRIIGFLRAA